MSHTMNIWESVTEERIRCRTRIVENQFGCVSLRSTVGASILSR